MRRFLLCLLAVLAAAGLVGCAVGGGGKSGTQYRLYTLNAAHNQIVERSYEPAGQTEEELILEFSAAIQTASEDTEALLPEGVTVQSYHLENGLLTLNMSEQYGQMDRSREILVRAALVQTFLQIECITRLEIQVDGEPLTDFSGAEVGPLDEDSFVVNSGKEINTYENTQLTLYFADEEGEHLLPEQRSVYYSTNLPLERVVVEQLVRGPSEDGHFATLPAELNILSVTTSEGICYVTFDESFTASAALLDPELELYSIVESLAASCRVDRVQFSVNGKNDVLFGDTMDLSQIYEADGHLIEDGEEP